MNWMMWNSLPGATIVVKGIPPGTVIGFKEIIA
jgi:hypothetical protein